MDEVSLFGAIKRINACKKAFDEAKTDQFKQEAAIKALLEFSTITQVHGGWALDYWAACALAWARSESAPDHAPADIWDQVEGAKGAEKRLVAARVLEFAPGRVMAELQQALYAAHNGQDHPIIVPSSRQPGTANRWTLQIRALQYQAFRQGAGKSRSDAIADVEEAYGVLGRDALTEWAKTKNQKLGGAIPANIKAWTNVARAEGEALRARGGSVDDHPDYGRVALEVDGRRYQVIRGEK
ncbi:hypothetical protein WV31_05455 [Magnetospirillum sp. ME-1]|uniref:hypothetical protein n=1 Tax=Magnetospirillum sp. ME-1 TaxID=1639348 RepID=UPI000A17D64C|nr:hypothetical protein [Magnetospirillum sp. ME-1]ARJ65144.1 hypothetical protein WV31_05455 [Magnetospirillum sp. ME-1]